MTALRELADQMDRAEYWNVQEAYAEIKAWRAQLLAILDADGDGVAVDDEVQCAHCCAIFKRRDWIADNFDRPIPRCQFCGSSGEPKPVRATAHHPARSGGVSDADANALKMNLSPVLENTKLCHIKDALTHFAKGAEVGGDAEDAARYRWLRISACEIAWNEWCSYAPGYSANGPEELDQAIDAARKGERHE